MGTNPLRRAAHRSAVGLLALACAVPAAAARREKPDKLRDGSRLDGAPVCRDLKPHSSHSRWEFAPSKDNHMNCGAGGGDSSNYVIATDPDQPYELHVISVDEGSFPFMTGDPGMPEASVQVVVYRSRKPVVLALAARDATLWDVTVTPEARVELVIIQGKGKQVLRGVPDEIPVVHRSWQQACAYAHAWEARRNLAGPDFPLLITSLRCSTGLRESSFQGCTQGALFEVPHYRQEGEPKDVPGWTPPCPLPVEPDAPLVRRRDPRAQPEAPEPPLTARRPPPPAEPEPPSRAEPEPMVDPMSRLSGGGEALASPVAPPERHEAEPPPEKPLTPPPAKAAAPAVEKRALEGAPQPLPAPAGAPAREDIPVRALAILERGETTLLTHDAVPDLIVALERGDETLRWRAADALGQLGAASEKAVPALLKAAKAKSWRVRSSAALALGNVGVADKKVLKTLKKLLKDDHPDTRHSAQTALSRLHPN